MSDLLEKSEIESSEERYAVGRVRRLRDWARPRGRRLLAGLVLVVVVITGAAWWLGRGLPGDVALSVDGHRVTVAELHDRVSTLEALYGVTEPADAATKARFWRDAAQSVAVGLVMDRAASGRGITVSDNVVDAALQQVITRYFGSGQQGHAAFVTALGNAGTSQAQVTDEIRRQLVVSRLYDDVTGAVPAVSDAEVTAAYAQRRCSLRVPEQRVLANIVVGSRSDATRVLSTLRAGAPFSAVASRVSLDGSTRSRGGALGKVGRADLQGAYADAAFTAGQGDLFGPVRTQSGWNVGQVRTVVPAHVPSLPAVRTSLRQELLSEARNKVWSSWLREQIDADGVRYNDAYRPADPDAVPSAAVPTSSATPATGGSC